MKFYLYEEQDGGCDYTIGCGKRLTLIKGATTMEEAIAIATAPGDDPMISDHEEMRLAEARILAVVQEEEINLDALYSNRDKANREAATAKQQAQEKAEYERLQAKYGKGAKT